MGKFSAEAVCIADKEFFMTNEQSKAWQHYFEKKTQPIEIDSYQIGREELRSMYKAVVNGNASPMIWLITKLKKYYDYIGAGVKVTYINKAGREIAISKETYKAFLDEEFPEDSDFLYKETFSNSHLYK